jgi:hypothetical protein
MLSFNERPDGRLPDVTDQAKGGTRPVSMKVYEYATNSVPFGSGLGDVMLGAGALQAISTIWTMINKVNSTIMKGLKRFGRISLFIMGMPANT